MAHTTISSSYVFNFGTAFTPSICLDVLSFSSGGANAGISFRDEGNMLTVHSSEMLRLNSQLCEIAIIKNRNDMFLNSYFTYI